MEILLYITDNLYISFTRTGAGHEGDHNHTRFIINRPQWLDNFICRIEFSGTITSYSIVDNDVFLLPNSLTKAGELNIQLVYSHPDNEIIAKTNVITVNIGESINAIDETDTEFQDGLAQLAIDSIASGSYENSILTLFNRAGDERFSTEITGGGSGIIDPTINTRITALESSLEAINTDLAATQTTASEARSIADLAAIKAATAGARTEEINTALSNRIAAIEAQLGI